jgi:hypothetical protein
MTSEQKGAPELLLLQNRLIVTQVSVIAVQKAILYMFHVSRHIAVLTVSAPLKGWDCHMQVSPNVCTDVKR